ncbi:MAG: hypothetical protein A2268_12855 [Candidatus Raymondbacteria bacterium RifOxyA12_full_50_37]|uniref:Prepilin-type N-terminal cleavage/methylation domain-containing protein n=1 Tax=Candidatus Raymondbacteria bacterium RIFOXYD12_FULL_49_13 TaxID=1817890 RepID=A0A1F7FJE2_UNCRA|nr:MAG: hypothetical protein A2268_12855 [Candidatus Raymondbacteria bacterium RifOxyA12_full_50_37]OGJ90774.1 MAG: hypothetical protein A2248_02135 [Candidatus Raymondbacteria bacterium RIFOXYA2_FULL_49_16]OGJ91653.1 MAG: hypothetical protein A2350_00420 [Candidatus Raymondbacteria bacterium RifOxyB12_full_50_8]OGJ97268.1 MAG: hypothetical protein A2487_16325 [Candidatus Raymondbacteria bacterium RifOxyC12_full_50_8]OGJ97341.1 MAG: hypothetical protein A2453_03415 [Candidatus Raymondbacteria b
MKTDNAGFSMTEILVALAIFSAIGLPLTAYVGKLTATPIFSDRVRAVEIAVGFLEESIHGKNGLKNQESVILFRDGPLAIKRTVSGEELKKITIFVEKSGKIIFDISTLVFPG